MQRHIMTAALVLAGFAVNSASGQWLSSTEERFWRFQLQQRDLQHAECSRRLQLLRSQRNILLNDVEWVRWVQLVRIEWVVVQHAHVLGGSNYYGPSGSFSYSAPNAFGGFNYSGGAYSSPNALGGFNFFKR